MASMGRKKYIDPHILCPFFCNLLYMNIYYLRKSLFSPFIYNAVFMHGKVWKTPIYVCIWKYEHIDKCGRSHSRFSHHVWLWRGLCDWNRGRGQKGEGEYKKTKKQRLLINFTKPHINYDFIIPPGWVGLGCAVPGSLLYSPFWEAQRPVGLGEASKHQGSWALVWTMDPSDSLVKLTELFQKFKN